MAEMTCRCDRDQNSHVAISARQLADMPNVPLRQVWRLSTAGELPKPIGLGGSVRWSRQGIMDWFQNGCPARQAWEARKAVRS